MAFCQVLRNTKLVPAPGPLHVLFPVPSTRARITRMTVTNTWPNGTFPMLGWSLQARASQPLLHHHLPTPVPGAF